MTCVCVCVCVCVNVLVCAGCGGQYQNSGNFRHVQDFLKRTGVHYEEVRLISHHGKVLSRHASPRVMQYVRTCISPPLSPHTHSLSDST